MRHKTFLRAGVIVLGVTVLTTACETSEAREGDVSFEYVAHASFRITSDDGNTVLVDPFASNVWIGYEFPPAAMENVDAILITHPHYDHDGGRYRELPLPWDEGMRVLDAPDAYDVGDVSVVGIEGKHADPYGTEFGQINTIWLLEIDGLRIAHVGDNGPLSPENVTALGRVDVLMLPIDAEYHILSEETIQDILMAVRPSFLIPMHYRHDALEREAGKPEDLGSIDPWIEDKDSVIRLPTNTWTMNVADIPDEPKIVVFRHSPDVTPP